MFKANGDELRPFEVLFYFRMKDALDALGVRWGRVRGALGALGASEAFVTSSTGARFSVVTMPKQALHDWLLQVSFSLCVSLWKPVCMVQNRGCVNHIFDFLRGKFIFHCKRFVSPADPPQ